MSLLCLSLFLKLTPHFLKLLSSLFSLCSFSFLSLFAFALSFLSPFFLISRLAVSSCSFLALSLLPLLLYLARKLLSTSPDSLSLSKQLSYLEVVTNRSRSLLETTNSCRRASGIRLGEFEMLSSKSKNCELIYFYSYFLEFVSILLHIIV